MNEQILKDIRSAIDFFSSASIEAIDKALEEADYAYYSKMGPIIQSHTDLVVPWEDFVEEQVRYRVSSNVLESSNEGLLELSFKPIAHSPEYEYQLAA